MEENGHRKKKTTHFFHVDDVRKWRQNIQNQQEEKR